MSSSSSTQPSTTGDSTIVASGATLTAEIYPHLLALVPAFAKVAPASALAWITTVPSPHQLQVQVHVFKTDAIPSAPQYSEKTPTPNDNAPPKPNSSNLTCLPDPHALIATVTFTDAFTIQSPVMLGPAAPSVPPHLHLTTGKAKDKPRKTVQALPTMEHVRAAYMWCKTQAAAQGKLLPWPASAAPLAQVAEKPKSNARLFKDRLMRLLFWL